MWMAVNKPDPSAVGCTHLFTWKCFPWIILLIIVIWELYHSIIFKKWTSSWLRKILHEEKRWNVLGIEGSCSLVWLAGGSSTFPPWVSWRHLFETSPGSSSKNPEDVLNVLPGEGKVLLCDAASDPSCSQWGHRKELLVGRLGEDCWGIPNAVSAALLPRLPN